MIYLWTYGYVFVGIAVMAWWNSLWGKDATTWECILVGMAWPFMLPWIMGSHAYSLFLSLNQWLRK